MSERSGSVRRSQAAAALAQHQGAGAYLDLLARVLADLDLDTAERADLHQTATRWGLGSDRVEQLQQMFVRQVGPHLNDADSARLAAVLSSGVS